MTTTQHTQGPWEAEEYGVIRGRNGMIRPFICQVQDDHNDEETQANAHLIAAAPELLDVVKRIYAIWDDPDRSPSELADSVDRDWIRAAIAKAEGRAE